MQQDNDKNSVRAQVLDQIKDGSVKMRSRAYFVLRTVLYILGAVLVLLLAIFLESFILFSVQRTGAWFMPGFGFSGWGIFLTSFPWVLLLLVLLFVFILEALVAHFHFSYSKPVVYTILSLVGIVVAAGFFLRASSLHNFLLDKSYEGNLPLAGPMYQHYAAEGDERILIGELQAVTENEVTIRTVEGEILQVRIDEQTRMGRGVEYLEGTVVAIIVDYDNEQMTALGIRPVNRQFDSFSPRNLHRGPGMMHLFTPLNNF